MKTSNTTAKTRRRKLVLRLAIWTAAWVLTVALANFGSHWGWERTSWLSGAAIALNLIVGMGMVLANRRLLDDLDELERKVQLEAMALTLGLTLVVGLAYTLLDATNLIPSDAEISILVLFMGICYLLALAWNTHRYR